MKIMTKRLLALCFVFPATILQADELSDECQHSMQAVYKFYYQEIKPKVEKDQLPKTLGPIETAQMQTIVNELKSKCPAPVIAKINQFLQEDDKA